MYLIKGMVTRSQQNVLLVGPVRNLDIHGLRMGLEICTWSHILYTELREHRHSPFAGSHFSTKVSVSFLDKWYVPLTLRSKHKSSHCGTMGSASLQHQDTGWFSRLGTVASRIWPEAWIWSLAWELHMSWCGQKIKKVKEKKRNKI